MERRALRQAVLLAARTHPLTLILAPPGSGKTSLLAQVKESSTAQGGEDDASSLTIIDDFATDDGEGGADPTFEIEELTRQGRRVLLAADRRLDDRFAALRIRGEVAEFSMEDLALTPFEVPAFLGEDLATTVSERAQRAIQVRTEGWIGGWVVVRELLNQGVSPADLAQTFSGRDRGLAAYFDRLVIRRLSPEVAAFLRDVAPLDYVTEASARVATERASCSALIAAAKRECSFFFDIDRNGDSQRLHRLLRDHLVAAAKAIDADRYAAIALRTADFLAREGDWLVAARLYSEGSASERSAEILRRHADEMIMGRGEIHGFRRLVGRLPDGGAQGASLSAEQALGSLIAGDFAGAAALVQQANATRMGPGDDTEAKLQAIETCIAFGLERFQQVRQTASAWLQEYEHVDGRYRIMVAAALFWSCLAERDRSGAQRALRLAREALTASRSPFLEGWVTIMAATDRYEHGEVRGAARVLGEAADSGMIRNTVNLVRATVALEQGRLTQARQLVQTSLHLGTLHSIVETSLYGWDSAARVALHDHGLAAALRVLEEAESVVTARHGVRATALVRLRRATLILQTADGAGELERELETIVEATAASGHCASFVEEARLTLARSCALCGDPRRAITLVQPIQAAAQRSQRTGRWGVASFIYAHALARLDEPDRAFRKAWLALARMVEGGFRTSVVDEQLLLRPLLGRLIDRAKLEDGALCAVVDQLAEQSGVPWPPPPSPTVEEAPPSDRLTETERRVLDLAAQGWSNARIAAHLSVRVTTVKWHMKNVFAKLSVRSRTAAVVELRRQGMA